MMEEVAIAILAFDRAPALAKLVSSLKTQSVRPDPRRLFLFQDGVINRKSHEKKTSFERHQAAAKIAHGFLPHRQFIQQTENLGIAEHYQFAERFIFEEMKYPFAIFLEDDFILSPEFLRCMERLLEIMRSNLRIGYATAAGGSRDADGREGNAAGSLSICPNTPLWGHLVSREHWIEQTRELQWYFEIIGRDDYRYRDHAEILAKYRELGIGRKTTSQDGAKSFITTKLGRSTICTRKSFLQLQRVLGTHVTADFFTRLKPVTPGKARDISELSLSVAENEAIIKFQQEELAATPSENTPDYLRNLVIPDRNWNAQILDAEKIILFYRLMLGRQPSESEINAHLAGQYSVAEFRRLIFRSDEFIRLMK